MTDINDEAVMTRFLLDDLPPAERQAVEQRLTTDPVYVEKLAALEDDLILRWHRGELSEPEQELFAHTYFSSPARRARVAAGRQLIEDAERWRAATARGRSLWNWLWFWRSGPYARAQFAGIGAVGVLFSAVSPALLMPMDVTRGLRFGEQNEAGAPRQVESARRLAVAVTLAPVGDRGAADGLNLVVITPDADEIWLQFEVTELIATEGLEAMIEPLAGAIVEPVRPVRVARTSTAAGVALTVAADDLPDGDYVLRLRQAVTRDGNTIMTMRAFRVSHH